MQKYIIRGEMSGGGAAGGGLSNLGAPTLSQRQAQPPGDILYTRYKFEANDPVREFLSVDANGTIQCKCKDSWTRELRERQEQLWEAVVKAIVH